MNKKKKILRIAYQTRQKKKLKIEKECTWHKLNKT